MVMFPKCSGIIQRTFFCGFPFFQQNFRRYCDQNAGANLLDKKWLCSLSAQVSFSGLFFFCVDFPSFRRTSEDIVTKTQIYPTVTMFSKRRWMSNSWYVIFCPYLHSLPPKKNFSPPHYSFGMGLCTEF